MIRVITPCFFLHKTKLSDILLYIKGFMDVIGLMVLLSKYFFLVMLLFCVLLMNISNMIYLVILRGVLLVVFVTSMLMGSLTNVFVPFAPVILGIKGGAMFMIIMMVVIFL